MVVFGNLRRCGSCQARVEPGATLTRFRGRILPDSFCAVPFNGDRTGRLLKEMMRDIEKDILANTLHRVDGNQTHAARILQVSTTTLHKNSNVTAYYALLAPTRRLSRTSAPSGELAGGCGGRNRPRVHASITGC